MPFPTSSYSFLSAGNADILIFTPFSKRDYLLTQMRQKDELIDSLLKQVGLPYPSNKYGNVL